MEQLHPVKIYQQEHTVMQLITFAHVLPPSHLALVQLIHVLMAFASVDHQMLVQEQVIHVIVAHANAGHLLLVLEQAIHVTVGHVNVDHLLLALEQVTHVIVAYVNADQMMNAVGIHLFVVTEIVLQVNDDRHRLAIDYI